MPRQSRDAGEIDPQRPNPQLLVAAYCRGIFPMVNLATGQVEWFSPDPRGVIPLDAFHVPRSLARVVRQGRFEIRTDTAFEAVIRACAEPRSGHTGTWLDERLIDAYCALHRLGQAHSVEAWREGALVGGLYGVHLGAAFFGESMFHLPDKGRDASKVCLVHLLEILRAQRFALLDAQLQNPHVARFGCVEIPRRDYLARLDQALRSEASWPTPGALS